MAGYLKWTLKIRKILIKFLKFLQTIETKSRTIIVLLILLYALPYIARRQYYPFVTFDMFASIHAETIATLYAPYVIDVNGKILVNETFNPWPIRHADIHNSIEAWIKKDIAQELLASAGPHLLELSRRQHPKSTFKCYGIMRFQWPVSAPLEKRKNLMNGEKIFEYCDEN